MTKRKGEQHCCYDNIYWQYYFYKKWSTWNLKGQCLFTKTLPLWFFALEQLGVLLLMATCQTEDNRVVYWAESLKWAAIYDKMVNWCMN